MSAVDDSLTNEEAAAALNALADRLSASSDAEGPHADADRILLACAHPDVRAAYERVEEVVQGFWYA